MSKSKVLFPPFKLEPKRSICIKVTVQSHCVEMIVHASDSSKIVIKQDVIKSGTELYVN